MPSEQPAQRFRDILDNIDRIERYSSGLADFDAFAADSLRRDAIERCFSRISEAAVKLGDRAGTLAPEIAWHDIRGIGNILRHAYDGVDAGVLWNAARTELEPLKQACRAALSKLGECM